MAQPLAKSRLIRRRRVPADSPGVATASAGFLPIEFFAMVGSGWHGTRPRPSASEPNRAALHASQTQTPDSTSPARLAQLLSRSAAGPG